MSKAPLMRPPTQQCVSAVVLAGGALPSVHLTFGTHEAEAVNAG